MTCTHRAGCIGTVDLADASVTTAKLADGAVTTAKIAPGTSVDLSDGLDASAFATWDHDHDAQYAAVAHDHDTRYYTKAELDVSTVALRAQQ